MQITPPGQPKDEDLKRLADGLKAYNASQIGKQKPEKVAAFIKSDSGELLGGIYSVLNLGWLYIDWLWCHESIRGKGYGTKLVQSVEQYAISKSIYNVKLETASFQALDFYKKIGFEVYAELENFPVGHTNYYLKKELID